jgi:hypothetical protein
MTTTTAKKKRNPYPYRVVDTFNNTIISQHRTLKTAAEAEIRFRRACLRANHGACVPTDVEYRGKPLQGDELEYYYTLTDNRF